MKILNLHGFLGIADNKNYYALREMVSAENIISPQMRYKDTSPFEVIQILSDMVDSDDFIFVGQSLGGLFADKLSRKYKRPCILTNPCYYPFRLELITSSGIPQEFVEQYKNIAEYEKNELALTMCSDSDTVLPDNYSDCEKLSSEVIRVHGSHSTIENVGAHFNEIFRKIKI